MKAVDVIVWTSTAVYVATAVITLLALVGKVTLGGGDGTKHDEYMKWLFRIFIAEVVGASVLAFASIVQTDAELYAQQTARLEEADSLISATQTELLSAELRVDSLSGLATALRSRLPSSTTILSLPARDTLLRPMRTEELVREVRATSVGGGTESNDVRIPIPSGWQYVDHTTRVTSRNGEGAFDERLERAPDGGVASVVVSARATSASRNPLRILSGTRSWIAVEVRVRIRESAG